MNILLFCITRLEQKKKKVSKTFFFILVPVSRKQTLIPHFILFSVGFAQHRQKKERNLFWKAHKFNAFISLKKEKERIMAKVYETKILFATSFILMNKSNSYVKKIFFLFVWKFYNKILCKFIFSCKL
jgi:hypothetical protein